MPKTLLLLSLIAHFSALASPSQASDANNYQTFTSSTQAVSLVELFTSEGCSSCPPAERWLNSLSQHPDLWDKFVPIAFHVDYWNYLGWDDRFAQKRFSTRQRNYAHEFAERTVYTPGVRKDGREWFAWRPRFFDQGTPLINPQPATAGKLTLKVDDNGKFTAVFATNQALNSSLNIAVLGMDLTTQVSRGENSGKQLHHEFVAIGLDQYPDTTTNGYPIWSGTLPDHDPNISSKLAIAAWVTAPNSLKPIQATGGVLN